MNPIRLIKEKLYFLKKWYRMVVKYPRYSIDVASSLDYDSYWDRKRATKENAQRISVNEQMRADIVAKVIGNADPVTVGDIACGPGVIFDYLKDKVRFDRAIGYDSSDRALETAQSFGMETRKFDITNEHDLDSVEPADYYLLLEILEHIPHSEKVLTTLYQKSHKGVFFSFPNSGHFLYRLRHLLGSMPQQWIQFPNEHLRFWTARDLKWWIKALGFTQYEIFYYRGTPVLEKIWPAMFAGSFVVFISKK